MSDNTEKRYHSVMLIDDNEIDNLINQKMIEAANITEHIYTHTGAKSAIEFLRNMEKLENVANEVLPDVIFLDIDMPLMDGFEFCKRIRGYQGTNYTYVIVLTSHSDREAMSQG